MVAGYETTSTALAYSTYVLATRIDIQDRLVEEISKNTSGDSNADELYDTAMNLTYLDYFVREVLRMYPITSKAVGRICAKTTVVCGHTIEEGQLLTFLNNYNDAFVKCRLCNSTRYIYHTF